MGRLSVCHVFWSAQDKVREAWSKIEHITSHRLAIALGCPIKAPLYITDQVNMLGLMQHNVALNGLDKRVTPIVLDW